MSDSLIQLLSIRDRQGPVLAFDLRDILQVLNGAIHAYRWCILDLACMSADDPELDRIEAQTRDKGCHVSSEWLVRFATTVDQIIDGLFLAFPDEEGGELLLSADDLDLANFPRSRAVLAILAVDSTSFEVYAKDRSLIKLLQEHFQDTRVRTMVEETCGSMAEPGAAH